MKEELLDIIRELIEHMEGVTGCNPGSDSEELVDKAKATVAKYEE